MVASARMAVRSSAGSFTGSFVLRCAKCRVKPVQRSTSISKSVTLTCGSILLEGIPESFGLLRHIVLKRADLEARTVQLRIRQLIFASESIRLIESTP